jgi:hypothetical protein
LPTSAWTADELVEQDWYAALAADTTLAEYKPPPKARLWSPDELRARVAQWNTRLDEWTLSDTHPPAGQVLLAGSGWSFTADDLFRAAVAQFGIAVEGSFDTRRAVLGVVPGVVIRALRDLDERAVVVLDPPLTPAQAEVFLGLWPDSVQDRASALAAARRCA